jgi:hypothetical protein
MDVGNQKVSIVVFHQRITQFSNAVLTCGQNGKKNSSFFVKKKNIFVDAAKYKSMHNLSTVAEFS